MGEAITLMELKNTVAGMKGKSPGWDGIPPEFYLMFWDDLGQYFLAMIHQSIKVGAFFNDANSALITVLSKSNKDTTKCSNYRPISILNAEIKTVAGVLVTRLDPHITKLIHCDQTGFIKTQLVSDNI